MIPCPNAYDIFLKTVMDPVDRNLLESYIGWLLLGQQENIPQYIILYGKTGSGKTTISNALCRIFGGGRISYSAEMAKFANSPIAIIRDADADKIIRDTIMNEELRDVKFIIETNKLPPQEDPLVRILCMTGNKIAKPIFDELIIPGLWEMAIPYKYYCIDKLYGHLNVKGDSND